MQEAALFYKDISPHYETFNAEVKIWVAKWKNVPEKDRPNTTLTILAEISSDFSQTYVVFYKF